jgi:hypothetical protein
MSPPPPTGSPASIASALWTAALSASLILFASILIHELSHSVAARAPACRSKDHDLHVRRHVSAEGGILTAPST